MDRSVFEQNMNYAKTMHSIGEQSEYWNGYMRGLRRRYHGENFGTEEEHQLWLTANGDDTHDQRSAGYKVCYFGPWR